MRAVKEHLLGARGRGGFPVKGMVHDLAHAFEPPTSAGGAALRGVGRAAIGLALIAHAEFELVVIHIFQFYFVFSASQP